VRRVPLSELLAAAGLEEAAEQLQGRPAATAEVTSIENLLFTVEVGSVFVTTGTDLAEATEEAFAVRAAPSASRSIRLSVCQSVNPSVHVSCAGACPSVHVSCAGAFPPVSLSVCPPGQLAFQSWPL
jgi:hypothetical protein